VSKERGDAFGCPGVSRSAGYRDDCSATETTISGQAGSGALRDQIPLELRQGREHREDELSRCRRRIDYPILKGAQTRAARLELLNDLNQVLERATQAAQSPHDEEITLPQRG